MDDEAARYIHLAVSQAEFDVLSATRLKVQADICKELTWPEFFLELARRI
jgi:hypothetical protein